MARALSISAVSSSSLAWTSTSDAFQSGVELFPKLVHDGVRHQPGDVPAERRHLFDEARRQETVERARRHEQSLDLAEPVVHLRHLELVVEVTDGAQALGDDLNVVFAAEVHDQAVEGVDANIGVVSCALLEELDALLDGEQTALRLVDEHGDDDLVVELGGPADDVEMPVGHRIERAGADSAPRRHGRRPYQSVLSP